MYNLFINMCWSLVDESLTIEKTMKFCFFIKKKNGPRFRTVNRRADSGDGRFRFRMGNSTDLALYPLF